MKTTGALLFAAIMVSMVIDDASCSSYCEGICQSVFDACNKKDYVHMINECIPERAGCASDCNGAAKKSRRTTSETRFLKNLKRRLNIIW